MHALFNHDLFCLLFFLLTSLSPSLHPFFPSHFLSIPPGVIQDSSGVVSHSDSQQEGYEVPENFKTLHHLALQYVNQVSQGHMLQKRAVQCVL